MSKKLLDNPSQSSPLPEPVVPKLVPLHTLTGILCELLKERVPITSPKDLEALANMSGQNLNVIVEIAEALRPT